MEIGDLVSSSIFHFKVVGLIVDKWDTEFKIRKIMVLWNDGNLHSRLVAVFRGNK